MHRTGPRIVLLILAAVVACAAQYSTPSDKACESDQVCEYDYSLEINQFRDQPMVIGVTLQIMCESNGFYGGLNATRYCMKVTDIGGNFLTFGDPNKSGRENYQIVKNHALERLSGWFCFVQTSDGQVVSVFHSQTEETEVVNIKKGIAAAFQVNFRGTAEEVEIDTQSRHISHYSYSVVEEGKRRMHRSVRSSDVLEYPTNIHTRDIQFNEEDDIEYKDGRLVKSSGTMRLSMVRRMEREIELGGHPKADNFSEIFTVQGSFSMSLRLCITANHSSRSRRAVREHLTSGSFQEESLMASFDQEKKEVEKLESLHKNFTTPEDVIKALKDVNRVAMLKQILVLERKHPPEGMITIEILLLHLAELGKKMSEGAVFQRVTIYSLLSSEGSARAENALIKRLQVEHITPVERNSIMLAIASLPTPSPQLINRLEEMITQSDETSTLLLVYGSLVANAGPDQELKMVTFLTDHLPEDTPGNTVVLIHILHALGNTRSSLAVKYILPFTQSGNEDVKLTAVGSLRFFIGLPAVQQHLLAILHKDTSYFIVEAIISTLRNGQEHNRDIVVDGELLECLTNVTLRLKNNHLQSQLRRLFKLVGYPDDMIPADSAADGSDSRHRRAISRWNSHSTDLDIISPESERSADVSNFPVHRGYFWNLVLGKADGEYKIYMQAAAGLFSGANNDTCGLKMMQRAVIRAHVFGYEEDIINIMGKYEDRNGTLNTKVYVKYAGSVVLDVDPSLPYNNQLPKNTLTLLDFSFPFLVFAVPISLGIEASVSLGGDVKASAQRLSDGSIDASSTQTPTVTLSIGGSASVTAIFATAGVSISGSISYAVSMEASVDVCSQNDDVACVEVNHGWPGINITLAAFYQLPFSLDIIPWDALSYTWTIPGIDDFQLHHSCARNESDAFLVTSSATATTSNAIFLPLLLLLMPLFSFANKDYS